MKNLNTTRNNKEKKQLIHITVKAFPSWKTVIIYPEMDDLKSMAIISVIEKDLQEFFAANKEKYILW